jgi:2-polyprenyl-3-methyl-5-hydroxy-6-metoxy-1,4-benzoquinol methylase
VDNKDLKAKYNEMHKQGSTAWFSDGWNERNAIIDMGEPWRGLNVLEIGCGEGDLAAMLVIAGAWYHGIDYSEEAIKKARSKYPEVMFSASVDYKDLDFVFKEWGEYYKYDRIVMQGVLEHLDEPFRELKWMIDNLLKPGGDVITSSPCFINPRGLIWMTLDMLGAVMSKTDLHFLHPWDFQSFCDSNNYELKNDIDVDISWGNGKEMIEDLRHRIPLALKDSGVINYNDDQKNINSFMEWLESFVGEMNGQFFECYGATAVYHIKT